MFLRSRIQCDSLFNNKAFRIIAAATCPQREHSSQTNVNKNNGQTQARKKLTPYVLSLTALGGAYYLFQLRQAQRNLPEFRHEHRRFDLPNYTMREIHERQNQGNIWCIYGRGVYDLTEYAKRHPGGQEMIAMAAGTSLEPFFVEYNFHRNTEIFELLESMRVGNLVHSHVHHYHRHHYHHHHHHQHREKPDRCIEHKVFPEVDPQSYRLELLLEGEKLKALKLEDLKLYPTYSVISSIPCKSDSKNKHEANVTVAESKWTGARLSDVLKDLGN